MSIGSPHSEGGRALLRFPEEEKERQGRRDARARRVKLCGVCKGVGTTGPMRRDGGYQERFTSYYWDGTGYVAVVVYVRRMGCWACNGSGLNCSQQRAAELEAAG